MDHFYREIFPIKMGTRKSKDKCFVISKEKRPKVRKQTRVTQWPLRHRTFGPHLGRPSYFTVRELANPFRLCLGLFRYRRRRCRNGGRPPRIPIFLFISLQKERSLMALWKIRKTDANRREREEKVLVSYRSLDATERNKNTAAGARVVCRHCVSFPNER